MEVNHLQVQMSENEPFKIMKSFHTRDFCHILMKNLRRCNLFTPTQIQKYAVPIIMSGKDLMANAPTKCGKTVAYCLPILQYLIYQQSGIIFDKEHCEPHVIIIAPTNELVFKICDWLFKFKRGTHIKYAYLFGSTDVTYQRSTILENGNHIIVATPIGLKCSVINGFVSFKSVKILVLDEADKMLDMGFRPYIEEMFKHPTMTSNDIRQTLIFSTTFPSEVQDLAKSFLKTDYNFVDIGDVKGACKEVEQTIHEVEKYTKKKTLLNLLKNMEDGENALVFVNEQRLADYLATYCCEKDIPATSIHELREQTDREEAFNNFKTNKMKVLIGTSILAKDLDINGVNYIVNYDLPKTIDEFIDRIELSGRLENVIKAVSFFDPECDGPIASELLAVLKQAKQQIPLCLSLINAAENLKVEETALNNFNELNESIPDISQDEDEPW